MLSASCALVTISLFAPPPPPFPTPRRRRLCLSARRLKLGRRYPILTKNLKPGETIKSDPGCMLSMGNDVKMSTGFMGKGLSGALSAGFGGDLIKTEFSNKSSSDEQTVGPIAPSFAPHGPLSPHPPSPGGPPPHRTRRSGLSLSLPLVGEPCGHDPVRRPGAAAHVGARGQVHGQAWRLLRLGRGHQGRGAAALFMLSYLFAPLKPAQQALT